MKKCILFALFICLSLCGFSQGKPKMNPEQLESYRRTASTHLIERNGRVNDLEGIFSKEEKHALDSLLASYEYQSAVDIAILTIDSTMVSASNFDAFAQHIADKWKLGKQTEDRGMLIAICRDHHRIRICNTENVRLLMTDEQTKMFIEQGFIPDFKIDDYYSGILVGLNMMMSVFR